LIEKYQEEVAKQKNFKITSHKLDLFGLCQGCQ
jgi:Fe2+ or Zn2+ uptake regulation protein